MPQNDDVITEVSNNVLNYLGGYQGIKEAVDEEFEEQQSNNYALHTVEPPVDLME